MSSVSYTFNVQGLPNFNKETTLTIVIPANAGPTYPVNVELPVSILADPQQVTGSPLSQFRQSLSMNPVAATPARTGFGSAPSMIPSGFDSASASVIAMTPKSLSPGEERLSAATMNQRFLPSVYDRSGTQPQPVLSPRGPSIEMSGSMSPSLVKSISPAQSSMGFAQSQQSVSQGMSPLAEKFANNSLPVVRATVSSSVTSPVYGDVALSPRSQSLKKSVDLQSLLPKSQTRAKSVTQSSLGALLVSDQMMSPKRFQTMRMEQSKKSIPTEEEMMMVDEEQEEEMMPKEEVQETARCGLPPRSMQTPTSGSIGPTTILLTTRAF